MSDGNYIPSANESLAEIATALLRIAEALEEQVAMARKMAPDAMKLAAASLELMEEKP